MIGISGMTFFEWLEFSLMAASIYLFGYSWVPGWHHHTYSEEHKHEPPIEDVVRVKGEVVDAEVVEVEMQPQTDHSIKL